MHKVEIVPQVAADDLPNVRALIETAREHDGISAIGEHKFLRVSSGQAASGVMAVLARGDRHLIGYGNTETFPIRGAGQRLSAELVVHPEARRRGVGSAMVAAILERASGHNLDRVDAWAYRQLPGTRELAAKFGFEPGRTLLQIRMRVPKALGEAPLPAGIALRSFKPGQDDADWLALNNLVFSGHPEQGSWDRADLDARLRQPWFDPQDFLIATNGGRLVAYNWLKLDHKSREGEIYVIGVHPDERRHHFGRSLSILGLQHMRQRGMHEVTAYVDEENSGALAMYQALGFGVDHADLCYSKPLKDSPPA